MKIYIGSDHAGFELKEKLKVYIQELGHEVEDKGAFALNNDDDFTDFIKPVAVAVAGNNGDMGIILGASGEGEAMCANRYKGVRAALYYGGSDIQTDIKGNEIGIVVGSRMHNNANILSLGARFLSEDDAKNAVKKFLETPFSNDERHIRRINKLEPNN
jgi:ribose 5-phosphate isomerase B